MVCKQSEEIMRVFCFFRALDITGEICWTLQLIAFINATTYLRQNVPTFTVLTEAYSKSQYLEPEYLEFGETGNYKSNLLKINKLIVLGSKCTEAVA